MMTNRQAAGKLKPDRLYLGDNGRCACGRLDCAGASAFYSGRDLSGQKMLLVSPAEVARYSFACETCGMVPATQQ